MFYRNYLEELYLPTSLSSAHYQDTVEWTVKTLSSHRITREFNAPIDSTDGICPCRTLIVMPLVIPSLARALIHSRSLARALGHSLVYLLFSC
eukprot:1175874-Prorocentrum_minimum.AAC.1